MLGVWSNPPDKEADHDDTTDDVAEEAAKYFSYLGKVPVRSSCNDAASRSLLAELSKWGVEKCTSDEIGADITIDEVEKVASHLPAGKSAGPDRLPNEFFSAFSQLLAPLLASSFNEMRSAGALAPGFNDGLVSILYKKGTRLDIRNYRPITLLNGDYKILTRILAKRMLRIVTQFVSDNQLGFVPRTLIAEAAMLIQLMQAHLENIDEGGILVMLDLEKAFDRCDWSYLHKALRELRFTSPFTSWIDMLYDESKGVKRKVIANGYLSKEYIVKVGTAQGCPLSPLLFLVIVEGFTRCVNNDNTLLGIQIGDLHHKISHFADDTIGFLKSIGMLARFENHIKTFCEATNMKENVAKRDYIGIGSLGHIPTTDMEGAQCVWSDSKNRFTNPGWTEPGDFLISLGIPIGNSFDVFSFLKGKYTKAKQILISTAFVADKGLVGKSRLLNANYYGKLRYYMCPLVFPNKLIKAMETDANSFLWRKNPNLSLDELGSNKKTGKWISAKATYRPIKKGGAGLLSLRAHLR